MDRRTEVSTELFSAGDEKVSVVPISTVSVFVIVNGSLAVAKRQNLRSHNFILVNYLGCQGRSQ